MTRHYQDQLDVMIVERRRELLQYYMAYKRLSERGLIGVLWLYWAQMGESPNMSGREVFTRKVMKNMLYLRHRTPWLYTQIRASFNEIGFELPDHEGFVQY